MGLEVVKEIQVLLAAYQGKTYLRELLDSLAAQDDGFFSVLLRDDGSTDGTVELLEQRCRQDTRFHLLKDASAHSGAAGSFLRLMRQASPEAAYFALCDQDDVWLPTRLSACRAAMAQAEALYGEQTPILVHSDAVVTDEQGHTLHDSFFAHQGWDGTAVTLPRLLVQNNVTGCTTLMNAPLKALIARYAQPEGMYMHDWLLALTAAACGHVVFVNKPLVRYRQHGTNVMGASAQPQIKRGLNMLGKWQKGKERMALTYRHTKYFRETMEKALPESALRDIDRYLATEKEWKLPRVWHVMRGGYTMQSTVTKLGQMLFG